MSNKLKSLTNTMSKIVSNNTYKRTYLFGYKMQKLAQLFKIKEPEISVLNTKSEDYNEQLYNDDLQKIYQFYKHPFLVHRMTNYDKTSRVTSF